MGVRSAEPSGQRLPWLTLRQRNDLSDYRPFWTEPERPDASAVTVSTPTGAQFDVTAPELAAELGAGVRVMKLDRGTFDTMPLSLITTNTVDSLGALLGTEVNVLGVRPNLVVGALKGGVLPRGWVGRADPDRRLGVDANRPARQAVRCRRLRPRHRRPRPRGAPRRGQSSGDVSGRVRIDTSSRARLDRQHRGPPAGMTPMSTNGVSGSEWAREKGDQMSAPNDQISEAPSGLAAPARRALAEAGFERWSELAAVSEAEIAGLHGFGKNALVLVREALDDARTRVRRGLMTTDLRRTRSALENCSASVRRRACEAG